MILNHSEKIIRLSRRIIFLFLVFLSGTGIAQNYYFENYSVSDGLAQSTVHNLLQDRNDIYWLGTQAGLSKFDGLEFTNYTAEDGLAEGGIRALIEDSHGNLWMGHDGGRITRFDGTSFEALIQAELHFKSHITTIIEDRHGHIWVASANSGAAVITNPTAPIENIKYEMFLGRRIADRLFEAMLGNDSTLYFVTDPVVKQYNEDSARFENLSLNGMPKYFATTSILEDSKDNFWFGTYHGGLHKYDPELDDTKMYDLVKLGMTSNWVSKLFEDRYGNIWIGTYGGGLARLDLNDKLTIFDQRNGLPGTKIWKISEDKEGNILIGTNEHGLYAFKGDYFVSYFVENGLINPQVYAITQATNGNFWFGTNEGISILDNSGELNDFKELKGEKVRYIEKDKNGSIWIGAESQGVFTQYTDGRFRYEPLLNSNIPRDIPTGMAIDNQNNLWVGTLDGLVYYEIDNRRVDRLTQTSGLSGNEISSVFADSKDRIWVGVEGKGLNLIEGTEFSKPNLGINITPRCFIEDKNGIIWIGTEGRGALAYDPEQKKLVKRLTVQDGLLANLINQLNCDEDNNIYIGTNKGLNKYLQDQKKVYSYTRNSGFVGIETKHNASYLDNEGNVWFGTGLGVTRYNPKLKSRDEMEPLTHITDLKVNYEPYPMEDDMQLSYRENSMIFDYRCITLNPEAVQYQIKLEGIDADWRTEEQTQVNYPALPPKKYTFYVKAKNSDGVWNDPPIALHFQIKPPFYKTWWFILSCIVALSGIVFAYIKYREAALRKENKILEDKVQERTAEVVAQKEELAQKNKDITDSITYAKRIQFAILPPRSPFPNTFIMFKPKDIVSGDFYWFTEVEGKEYIAAVDCTGHGVPGAFMSIIGHNSLNKIVNQYGILEPGKILEELNREVVDTLSSTEDGNVYDGMDLALISFDKTQNLIKYAGAYNSMYIVRNSELIDIRADRQPIGLAEGREKVFNTQDIPVEKGDMIYLFSDGFADQFGGEKLKKFKSKNMKELMVSVSGEDVDKQRDMLDNAIEKWRGDVEQIDDILIIGRKF